MGWRYVQRQKSKIRIVVESEVLLKKEENLTEDKKRKK